MRWLRRLGIGVIAAVMLRYGVGCADISSRRPTYTGRAYPEARASLVQPPGFNPRTLQVPSGEERQQDARYTSLDFLNVITASKTRDDPILNIPNIEATLLAASSHNQFDLQPRETSLLELLTPDRIYLTGTYSMQNRFNDGRFLKTAHESVVELEDQLSSMLGKHVDIKEWSDHNQSIITPGIALGWDVNDILEVFGEFSYGKGELETKGGSPHAYIPLEGFPGSPIVDAGPAKYKFKIARESTSIGVGPLVHVGELVNRWREEDLEWLGRGKFDPFVLAVGTYNWSSSDFKAGLDIAGGDVSSQVGLPPGYVVVPPTRIREKQHNTGRGPGFALGAGFNAPLTNRIDMNLTARYNWTHLDGRGGIDFDLDQWTVAVGIVIPIGSSPYNPKGERWNLIGNAIGPAVMYIPKQIGKLFD